MNHSKLDYCLGLAGVVLVVAVQSAAIFQPSKDAFDDPALGQDDELAGLIAFDDLDHPAEHPVRPSDELASVATTIDIDFLDFCNDAELADQHGVCAGAILNSRRMHDHGENEAQGIYRDVLLTSFGFLAGIETALPPFEALLIERESMMATEGSALRPAFCRAV